MQVKPLSLLRSSCGVALVAMLFVTGGCRSIASGAMRCATGDVSMTRDMLYFGRHRPDGGVVSDVEWRAFVDDALTPRFPDGLTIVSATGQWRGADDRIEREPSEVVTILHAGDVAARRAIDEIVDEYKRRFMQEAVLRERAAVCARF